METFQFNELCLATAADKTNTSEKGLENEQVGKKKLSFGANNF